MNYKIKIPDGCKVMNVEVTNNRIVLEVEKEENEFKENDIVFLDSVESVMIFDYIDDGDVIHTKCFYSTLQNKLSTKTINVCGKMRLATDSEKQLLFDKLKDKCLMFDGKDIVRWRCKKGDEYWFVGGSSEIKKTQDYFNGRWDDCPYGVGNYFPTREMAEAFQKQYIELLNNFHKNL